MNPAMRHAGRAASAARDLHLLGANAICPLVQHPRSGPQQSRSEPFDGDSHHPVVHVNVALVGGQFSVPGQRHDDLGMLSMVSALERLPHPGANAIKGCS